MATGIGSLVLKVGLNPGELTAGLAKAASSIKDFGTKAPKAMPGFASVVKGAVGVASAASAKFQDVLSKPLDYLSNITKQIPLVGQTLALPFDAAQGLMATYTEGAAKVEEMGRAAMRSGTDLASFQAIQHATKLDADALAGVLFKLNSKLTEGAMAGDEAGKAFNRYGLNAQEVFKLNGVERFAAIADAVAKIKDPALQAKAAFDLVGKKGGDMLLALQKGGAGVRKSESLLDRLGLRMTDQDFKNVKDAGEFAKTLKLLKESVTMEVTRGLAPYLAELNQLFDGAQIGAKGLSGYVSKFAEGFVYAGAAAVNIWKGFKSLLPDLSGWAQGFFAGCIDGLTTMVGLAEQLAGTFSVVGTAGNSLKYAIGVIPATFGWDPMGLKSKPGEGAAAGGSDKIKAAQERFNSALGNFGKTLGGGGLFDGARPFLDAVQQRMMSDQERLAANAERSGFVSFLRGVVPPGSAFAGMLGKASAALAEQRQQIEASSSAWKMSREGVQALYADRIKGYEDANVTPLEKFREGLAKLEGVYAAAKPFGLMQEETYLREKGRLYGELAGSVKAPEPKSPAAFLEGSREAYSAILAFQRGDRDDPQKAAVKLLEQAVAEDARQTEYLRQLASGINTVTVRRFN